MIHNDKLVAFYNDVEKQIIAHFGGYDRAASFFDWHCGLDALWYFTQAKYSAGWTSKSTAREWFDKNVGRAHSAVGKLTDKPKPTLLLPAPADVPADAVKHSSRGRYVEVEKEVMAARAARRDLWMKART